MKNFTRLMLLGTMLFSCLGGAKAAKTSWSPSSSIATWNSGTKTMTWTKEDTNGWHVMNSGLPVGDLSTAGYTKLHVEIASITNDISNPYITVKIASTGKEDQYVPIYVGVNNIVFDDYSSKVDFSKVTEISFWGSGDEGSAVITDCYLYGPVKTITVATGFGDEITSLSGITDGTKFVIANADASKAMYFTTPDAVDAKNSAVASVPADGYFYYQVTKVDGLDTDGDTYVENDNYLVQIFNSADAAYTHPWNLGSYLNYSQYGHTFAGSGASPQYGGDFSYGGIWKISYEEGNGFVFQCAGKKLSTDPYVYLKINGTQPVNEGKVYLKLFESINFSASSDLEKEDDAANDEIFALADATGFNAETGILKDGGWTFVTPVDLSHWDYLVITVENTSRTTDTYIKITDNSDNYVQTNQYNPENAAIGPQMYFGTYNNHNIACFSMDYLRKEKGLDIFNIKSLGFTGEGLKISSVYLTDYAHPSLATRGRWNYYVAGDVVRPYNSEGVGKFGTICLPYVASCTGAEVYSIEGKVGESITLTKVSGLLEAGKPYFYIASDVTGKDADVHNVNFFRADISKFDAGSAGTDNGLVGTFSDTKAPLNSYVLSSNKLYKVDAADAVTVGANKAYVDLSAIINPVLARGSVFIDFNEPTGIDATFVNSAKEKNDFYNLAGQRVAQPTKGLYIVNGKKVVIK